MNAEEINNQEFHAMREETQRTKVRDGDQEYEIFVCPIMRFPNAKKAKSGAEFFNNAYEYVVEYSSSHSDLIIYDLKTGKTFEETP